MSNVKLVKNDAFYNAEFDIDIFLIFLDFRRLLQSYFIIFCSHFVFLKCEKLSIY